MVFCTFLDATKAFDRIRYCKLFRLLSDRGIPPCIIRILLGFYTHNLVRVVWNGILSDYFLAVNGVKQGGVLSPIVFSLHRWITSPINELECWLLCWLIFCRGFSIC